MTNCIRTLITYLLTGIASVASVRIYVTDDNIADAVSVYTIEVRSDNQAETFGVEAFKHPMGETVKVTRLLNPDNTVTL